MCISLGSSGIKFGNIDISFIFPSNMDPSYLNSSILSQITFLVKLEDEAVPLDVWSRPVWRQQGLATGEALLQEEARGSI